MVNLGLDEPCDSRTGMEIRASCKIRLNCLSLRLMHKSPYQRDCSAVAQIGFSFLPLLIGICSPNLSKVMDFHHLQKSLSPSSSFSSSSSSYDAYPFSIDSELWQVAEERIQEILWIIQPSLASEHMRKEVIDYIRMLIKAYYSTEVLPFGSVPLKTYLPDGDIDLTVLSQQNKEDELAREICKVLKFKEQDPNSVVTEVRYIEAQVKVVKCCVKDISVDISFNQIPGLSTLCFLEKVDRLIGKNHLLKHSILLVKAWCFYESRILGAYHGLMSTYAVEILVLHVINIFHSSLPSPLAVLLRFLEYYNSFDWDNYCVSINGRVALSSLPGIASLCGEFVTTESMDNTSSDLLLTPEFLKNCREQFSVPVQAVENGGHEFPVKHLNILDPLKHNNNLGRSVSKGNFNRIKCAIMLGAQRVREIFKRPEQALGTKLEDFFRNTLDRIGKGERPDTPVPVPAFGSGKSQGYDLSGDYDNYYSSLVHSQWFTNLCSPPLSPQISPPLSPPQFQPSNHSHKLPHCPPFDQNTCPRRSMNDYNCISQPYAGTIGIDQLGKSRGTGTYIPNVHSSTYREFVRQRSPGTRYCSPFNSPQRTREYEVGLQEMVKRENGCDDLSMDQFPLLSSHKNPASSDVNRTDLNPLQADEYCWSLRGIEFGTYKPMPSPLSEASTVVKMNDRKSLR